VRAYTEEYRAEVDSLTELFDELTTLEPGTRAGRAHLRNCYHAWALKNGQRLLSAKQLAAPTP
jgi:hypothetical protein